MDPLIWTRARSFKFFLYVSEVVWSHNWLKVGSKILDQLIAVHVIHTRFVEVSLFKPCSVNESTEKKYNGDMRARLEKRASACILMVKVSLYACRLTRSYFFSDSTLDNTPSNPNKNKKMLNPVSIFSHSIFRILYSLKIIQIYVDITNCSKSMYNELTT